MTAEKVYLGILVIAAIAISVALVAYAVLCRLERRALERSRCTDGGVTRMVMPEEPLGPALEREAIELSNRDAARKLGFTAIERRRMLERVK